MDDIDIGEDSDSTPAPPLHGRGAAAASANSAALREYRKGYSLESIESALLGLTVCSLRTGNPSRSDWSLTLGRTGGRKGKQRGGCWTKKIVFKKTLTLLTKQASKPDIQRAEGT